MKTYQLHSFTCYYVICTILCMITVPRSSAFFSNIDLNQKRAKLQSSFSLPLSHAIKNKQTEDIDVTSNILKKAVTTFSILCILSSPIDAHAEINHGSKVFNSNCAACHRGGMNVVNEKRDLKKETLEKYFKLNEDDIQKFLKTGSKHRFMAFPDGKLSESDYADVVDFVVDQAKGDKW